MKELIDKIENLVRRVIRLETQESAQRYGLWASRPASPYAGQRYLATDNPASDKHGYIEWEWDGVNSQWVSVDLKSFQLPYNANGTTFPIAASLTDANRADRPNPNFSMWLVEISYRFVVNTTFDATNKWTGTLVRTDSTNADTTISTLTLWVAARAANTAYYDTATIGAAVTVANAWKFRIDLTKNSAPGTLVWGIPTINYRFIG